MNLNPTNIQFSSTNSSLKVLLQGTSTVSVPALAAEGVTFATIVIPHQFNSDKLLFQVASTGGPTNNVVLPWASQDGRISQYAYIDSTNLTIVVVSTDSSGLGAEAFTATFYYRILIP